MGGCARNPACDCKLGQHCRPSKKQHDCGNEKRDSEQQRRAQRSGFEFLMQYQSDYEVAKHTDEEPTAKHQGSPAILHDRKQSNDNSKSAAGQSRDQLCTRKMDASEKRSKEEHIPNPVLALTGRKCPAAVYPSATQGENNGEQPPEGDAQSFGLFNEAPAEESGSGEAAQSNDHQKGKPQN